VKTFRLLGRWQPQLVLAVLALAVFLAPIHSLATDLYWVGDSSYNWWDNAQNWSLSQTGPGGAGMPQNGDNVNLIQSGTTDKEVYYYGNNLPDRAFNWVTIDATGPGNITLTQTWYDFKANAEFIGFTSKGTVYQIGGTSTVSDIYIGIGNQANGSYIISAALGNPTALTAVTLRIGFNGTGTFTQWDGTTVTVSDTLTLGEHVGYFSPSVGTYELQGGSLTAKNLIVGSHGSGTFKHTVGTNTSTYLYLGEQKLSNGTYELSGAGSVQSFSQYVGYSGTGVFKQTGGVNEVRPNKLGMFGNLILGSEASGSGIYELSGTGRLSAKTAVIGQKGSGTFTQMGGTFAVTDQLLLAAEAGSSGNYNLREGNLTAGSIQVNSDGSFNQSAGTATSNLENRGSFTGSGGNLVGRITNFGIFNVGGSYTASAMSNHADFTIGAGNALYLNGAGLDNNAGITLAGGILGGGGSLVNNASMGGYGTIGGNGGFTNNALFIQSGGNFAFNNTGTNENWGNMDLAAGKQFTLAAGAKLANLGTFNLNSAIVNGTGALENGYGGVVSGKGTISSSFANLGGTLLVEAGTTNVSKGFNNTGLVQLNGLNANLVGGAIANDGTIQGYGTIGSPVANNSTIEALGGTLALSGIVTNRGLITATTGNKLLMIKGLANNDGVINLTGGTFDNNDHALRNNEQISGYGIFRSGNLYNTNSIILTGGATTVNGTVSNGSESIFPYLTVANTQAIFTGQVTNYGTVKTTSATVTWAGGFINNGAYISDPSKQYFTDLTVLANGYLQGGKGDKWSLSGNFIDQSTQDSLWNTALSDLAFTGGGTHQFSVSGTKLAWGSLDLTGQILNLEDGDSSPGGAFYVGKIFGLTFNGNEITNLTGIPGLTMYYDPTLNPGLNGNYTLAGGATLAAGTVPLPASVWLFLTGLSGLGFLGGRRKGKTS
jgi:hypothetical protein